MEKFAYHNRLGDAYYIHKLRHGDSFTTTYIMRKEGKGGLPRLPRGYEIRENVHGQVSIRFARKPVLLPQEIQLVRESILRRHAAGYELQADGPAITIFASSQDRRCMAECLDSTFAEGFESALAEKLPGKFTPEVRALFRKKRQARNVHRHKFYPLLRFVLVASRERVFRIERVCFTGKGAWLQLDTLALPMALMKYVSRLGDDSLFELL